MDGVKALEFLVHPKFNFHTSVQKEVLEIVTDIKE